MSMNVINSSLSTGMPKDFINPEKVKLSKCEQAKIIVPICCASAKDACALRVLGGISSVALACLSTTHRR